MLVAEFLRLPIESLPHAMFADPLLHDNGVSVYEYLRCLDTGKDVVDFGDIGQGLEVQAMSGRWVGSTPLFTCCQRGTWTLPRYLVDLYCVGFRQEDARELLDGGALVIQETLDADDMGPYAVYEICYKDHRGPRGPGERVDSASVFGWENDAREALRVVLDANNLFIRNVCWRCRPDDLETFQPRLTDAFQLTKARNNG